MVDRTRWRYQDVEVENSKYAPIGHHVYLKTIQSRTHVQAATHQGGDIYIHNIIAV